MPVFVARQWMRHRMASINEISARYTEVDYDKRYIPTALRKQSTDNKQCSSGEITDPEALEIWENAMENQEEQWNTYVSLCEMGVGREQARMLLPQNMITEFYWKIDLHNLLKFLELRTHHHAQQETREIAEDVLGMLRLLCPCTMETWEEIYR